MSSLLLQTALRLHQAGRLSEAEGLYRQVLAEDPRQADAHHLLGLLALEDERVGEALECLQRAAALHPRVAAYHKNLARAYAALNRPAEAAASCRSALDLEPGLAEAHLYLGNALIELKQFSEAESALRTASALQPDSAPVQNSLGSLEWQLGRIDKSIAHFRQAIERDPAYATPHNGLGAVYLKVHSPGEAEASFRRALELRPRFPRAMSNLGIALTHQGRTEEAIRAFEQALAWQPDLVEGLTSLGLAYLCVGRLEEATDLFRRTLAAKPDYMEVRRSLMATLLLRGCFEEGWQAYEGRPLAYPAALREKPRWEGEPLEGRTLLLLAEQGFGDTLHFFRFGSVALERSPRARIVLECQPELARLLTASAAPGIEIRPRGQSYPAFDCYLHLLSLPLRLGRLSPWAPAEPYLRVAPDLRAKWRERLGPRKGPRVGIAWRGSPDHELDRWRSIPLGQFCSLLTVSGLEFHSLQLGEPAPPGTLDFTTHLTDFAETAAYVSELDLIVSADTALIHLAGALGRPVWTLLAFVPDWRWGFTGETTAWYPNMRLFRQPKFGDWESVVARVAHEFAGL